MSKAGLRLVSLNEDGTTKEIPVRSHECIESGKDTLTVFCNTDYGQFELLFNEDAMTVAFNPASSSESLEWAMEFNSAKKDVLPFTKISDKAISASHKGYDYNVRLIEGNFSSNDSSFADWLILPQGNRFKLSGVLTSCMP